MDKHVISRQNRNCFQSNPVSLNTIRYLGIHMHHHCKLEIMRQETDKNYYTISTDHLQKYMLVEVVALFTLGQCFVGLTELREGHPQNHDLVVVRCDLTLRLL